MKYKVSVLMTVYNAGDKLNNSISSILEQTYSNFEFIIIDDGSSDNSKEIISYYAQKDKRIIYIDRKENKGRVYSLNEGLDYCNSKFLFINDADDVSHRDRIEKQIKFYEDLKDKDSFGVIGTASRTINTIEKTNIEYNITYGTLGNKIIPKWRIYIGMPFIHSSFLYNVDKLKKINGFANEVTSLIDYLTLNKLAISSSIYGLNEILVDRYVDGSNFFMQKNILSKRQENINYIRKWQKDNFKLNFLYKVINKIKIIIKKRDL